MSKIVEKIKDWFTDALGGAMMVISLTLVYTKSIPFMWEGFSILMAGFVLMAIPDKEIAQAIKNWADKKFGNK